MKVITTNRAIVLSAIAIALALISGGSAQIPNEPAVDKMGDLSARVPQEDLDAYWSDNATWAFYGYRPQTQTHMSRFMGNSMPSYFAGQNGYSFGTVQATPNVSLDAGLNQKSIQYTGGGTWH